MGDDPALGLGHRAYRWFYRDSRYRPWLIAEFLILSEEMPRSLASAISGSIQALDGLGRSMASAMTATMGAADLRHA